jgi:hypothetical protein
MNALTSWLLPLIIVLTIVSHELIFPNHGIASFQFFAKETDNNFLLLEYK